MKGRKGFTLIELLVVIAIIAVLAAILFPVFAKARKAAQQSTCQSNFKQIGNAMKMYLTDWEDTYPTNRPLTGGVIGTINPLCALSPSAVGANGEPIKFQNSVNWVEGLYQYVEQVTKKEDASSIWRCPAAANTTWPTSATYNPAVNITFNGSLVEQPEGMIKKADSLMLCREFPMITCAVLRPMNQTSVGTSAYRPQYPFCANQDYTLNTSKVAKLHGNGSHILFADGHVKLYSQGYMPEYTIITAARSWDSETNQWYNFVYPSPANATERALNKSIAITP